jgi:hypothetical protein
MNNWNEEHEETIDMIWRKAKTDSGYATAAAILHLSRTVEINFKLVGLGQYGYNGDTTIGCLEKIAMELEETKGAIRELASNVGCIGIDGASVNVNLGEPTGRRP